MRDGFRLGASAWIATLIVSILHPADAFAGGALLDRAELENRFAQSHPEGGLLAPAKRIRRVWGARLSVGDSPSDSATRFFAEWSGLWGVQPDQLRPEGPFEDGRHLVRVPAAAGARAGQELTVAYFAESVRGVPVYRAHGWALMTDEAEHPVVLAGGTLRPLGELPERLAAADLDPAGIARTSFAKQAGAVIPGASSAGTPRYVIWAGIDDDVVPARLAVQFRLEGPAKSGESGRQLYELVTDPATGEILHQESLVRDAVVQGTVSGQVTNGKRADACDPEAVARLPYTAVSVGSQTIYGDSQGVFQTGNLPAPVAIQPSFAFGRYFRVVDASGSVISVPPQTAGSGSLSFLFNAAPSELSTAQVNAYYHANVVRDFSLRASPNFPVIGSQLGFQINVNIASACNAYYDGSSINFFQAGSNCNNTAFGGVVHHEYGHHLVTSGGSGQGAFGEGLGDVMSCLILDDPNLGVGFFQGNCSSGIRNASNTCQFSDASCSSCGSEIHACGQLLSGIVWDLRRSFGTRHGSGAIDRVAALAVNEILLHSGQSDIGEDIRLDYLTLDDDNGNLADGTPNSDLINEAFRLHGFSATPAPTGVSASDGTFTDRIRVAWNAVPGATGYRVMRSVGSGAATPVATPTGNSFDDLAVSAGSVYSYSVVARAPQGDSRVSASDTGFVGLSQGPSGFSASDGTFADRVALSWSPVADATGYKIRRWIPEPPGRAQGPGMSIADFSTTQSVATLQAPAGRKVGVIRAMIDGFTHSYQGDLVMTLRHGATTCTIMAECNGGRDLSGTYVIRDGAGVPMCSQTGTGGEFAPSSAFSAAFAGHDMAGDWILSVSDVAGGDTGAIQGWTLEIDAAVAPTLVATATAANAADTGATPGTLYSYSVAAIVGGRESATSTDGGWRNLPPPTNVAASDGTYSDRVVISWSAVPGATNYRVRRGPGTEADPEIALVSGTQFSDLSAPMGEVVKYTVCAVGALGDGVRSAYEPGQRASANFPAGFSASDGTFTDRVALSWTAVPGARSYKVFRGATPASLGLIATTSATNLINAPTAGVVWHYAVRATLATGDGPMSAVDSGWRNVAAPRGGVASAGAFLDRVTLSWTAVPGVTSYRILRSSASQPATEIGTSAVASFNDLTAEPAVMQNYRIVAITPAGASAASASFSGWRNIPGPAVAASDGAFADRVTLAWDPVPGAVGYRVLRGASPTALAEIGSVTGESFLDSSAAPGQILHYAIRAVLAIGPTLSGTVDPGWRNLPPPTGVVASDSQFQDRVEVRWNAVQGAVGYRVLRGVSIESLQEIGAVASTSFIDRQAMPGSTYLYAVRAVSAAGLTDPSEPDEGAVAGPPALALQASDGSRTDGVRLDWNAVPMAARYKVFRSVESGSSAGSWSGPGLQIRDYTTSSSTLRVDVPAGTQASGVRVTLSGFQHTWQSDLIVTLRHGGVACELSSYCNGSVDLNGTYVVKDAAPTPLCSQPGSGGDYRPVMSLDQTFGSVDAAGEWILEVRDAAGGDVGSISGWSLSFGGGASGSGSGPSAGSWSGPGLQIRDYTTSSSTLRVDLPVGTRPSGLRVTLSGFQHTWQSDLVVTLRHGGAACVLSNSCNGSMDLNGTYVLKDAASTPLCGQPGSGGDYRPATPLDQTFGAIDAAGDWVLEVQDTAGGDVGSIGAWSLTFGSGGSGSGATAGPWSGPGLQIRDYTTSTSTLRVDVPAGTQPSGLLVTISGFHHTWQSDLLVVLRHGGVACELSSHCNGSVDLNGTYVLKDSASTPLCGQLGTGGDYRPVMPLDQTFGAIDAAGDWVLEVQDSAGGDVGSITGWSLAFDAPGSGSDLVEIASVTTNGFLDVLASPGTHHQYRVDAIMTSGAVIVSGSDEGWRGGGVRSGGSSMVASGAWSGGGSSLVKGGDAGDRGRERWMRASLARSRSGFLGALGDMPEALALALLAPIPLDDPAWQVDCAGTTEADALALVRAGSRDMDGDGEPDLCQRSFGDLDLNGSVDHDDLAMLLLLTGETSSDLGDLNHDGVVDHVDVDMLRRWIDEPPLDPLWAPLPDELKSP